MSVSKSGFESDCVQYLQVQIRIKIESKLQVFRLRDFFKKKMSNEG